MLHKLSVYISLQTAVPGNEKEHQHQQRFLEGLLKK